MKKLIMTTALALGLASPAYAQVTVCGPVNGNGCELQDEQKIFLNEVHDSATITGNVGANNSGPLVVISADTGTFDTFLDAGGGFATIDASHGFKSFNGVDITIPGYTFTDLVFEVQMERQGGKKGDTELDQFEIKAGDLGTFLLTRSELDGPDALFQFNVLRTGGVLDELNLFADNSPLSGGFFEIKHLQVSGLEPFAANVPEAKTWVMLTAGFGLMGLAALKRRHSRLALGA